MRCVHWRGRIRGRSRSPWSARSPAAACREILKRFAAEYPGVELSLRTATSAEVSDLIRRGEATIGLRYDRDRSRDLDCELLLAERLQVVCAPDHPRAGRRVAKLADLRGERWIAFPVLPGRREITASHVFALFQTHGLGEVDWTPVDSLTAQKRLVEAGLGIALLSESNAAEELKLRFDLDHPASAISRRAMMSLR